MAGISTSITPYTTTPSPEHGQERVHSWCRRRIQEYTLTTGHHDMYHVLGKSHGSLTATPLKRYCCKPDTTHDSTASWQLACVLICHLCAELQADIWSAQACCCCVPPEVFGKSCVTKGHTADSALQSNTPKTTTSSWQFPCLICQLQLLSKNMSAGRVGPMWACCCCVLPDGTQRARACVL
jgi:hypothetical protein